MVTGTALFNSPLNQTLLYLTDTILNQSQRGNLIFLRKAIGRHTDADASCHGTTRIEDCATVTADISLMRSRSALSCAATER